MTSVTTARPVAFTRLASSLQAFSFKPWKLYGLVRAERAGRADRPTPASLTMWQPPEFARGFYGAWASDAADVTIAHPQPSRPERTVRSFLTSPVLAILYGARWVPFFPLPPGFPGLLRAVPFFTKGGDDGAVVPT